MLIVALVLVVLGGFVANLTQTDFGRIIVRSVRFSGQNGQMMYGLLYRPVTATAKTPACGVVAIHGYINSHDTMDGFAVEMARRGCVVLAVDQTGHGFSDPPAFANGYGGPDALRYLASLDIVKKGDIGLIGHSMGGWASVLAAYAHPADYRSVVLVSSSTSTPPYEPLPGTPRFPKNTEVVEARYSEFAQLMWGVPRGDLFADSSRMQALFGTHQPIETGRVYGSVADGTARELFVLPDTHPGLTFDGAAIADAVAWMQRTLVGVSPLAPGNQIWIGDEIGTFVALVGVVLLIFPLGTALLQRPFFADLVRPLPEPKPLEGWGRVLGVVLTIAVSLLTFYPLQVWGSRVLPAGSFFSESITTGVMVWALGNAVVALAFLLLWHFGSNRRRGARGWHYGLTNEDGRVEWRRIAKAALFAAVTLVGPYGALAFLNWAFGTDARIWVFNAKVITPVHLVIALHYVVAFAAYFVVLGLVLHGELRRADSHAGREMVQHILMLAGGFVLLLLYEYLPLLAGGTLATVTQPLLTIVGFQFVPIFIIAAAVSTFFFYRTGRIYVGAFVNAAFVTLLMVTSTAVQFPSVKPWWF